MLRRAFQLLAALAVPAALTVAAVVLLGCDQGGGGDAGVLADDAATLELSAIDAARADTGLTPLQRDRDLDFAAQAHADFLLLHRDLYSPTGLSRRIQRFDLDAFLAETPAERIRLAGFDRGTWRHELITDGVAATTTPSVEDPGYGRLLDPAVAAIGVGVARDGDTAIRVLELASSPTHSHL